MREPTRNGSTPLRSHLLAVLGLLAMPVVLTSCNTDPRIDAASRIGAPADQLPVDARIGQLLENPEKFMGLTVVVAGEVNDVLGPHAFTIGGEEFFPPGEVLVVSPTGFPSIPDSEKHEYLVDEDVVQVTGRLARFNREALAQEFPPGALQSDALNEWAGKPVIVVTNMVSHPRARDRGVGMPPAPQSR